MDAFIKKIYNMMYSPIVTPYNLLDNAKIDSYSYVKYYKIDKNLIAEMECDIPQEGKKVFYYHFDEKDYLQKIYMECSGLKEMVFDRSEAVKEAKNEYYEAKPVEIKVIS